MSAHKYWRLTNIAINTNEPAFYIAAAEIKFNDIANYDASKAFAAAVLSNYVAYNAFDNNPNTFCHIAGDYPTLATSRAWYIGYQFDTAIELTTVSLQMRQDLPQGYDRSWQTADVEYSDDGQTWTKYGTIEPKFAYKDLSLKTVNIIRLPYVGGNSKQNDGIASRFVLINDWQTGDFIKKITPQTNGDWEYIPPNNNKLIVSHIGADGFAPKIDAPITPASV